MDAPIQALMGFIIGALMGTVISLGGEWFGNWLLAPEPEGVCLRARSTGGIPYPWRSFLSWHSLSTCTGHLLVMDREFSMTTQWEKVYIFINSTFNDIHGPSGIAWLNRSSCRCASGASGVNCAWWTLTCVGV
jgi:hypothetical protein